MQKRGKRKMGKEGISRLLTCLLVFTMCFSTILPSSIMGTAYGAEGVSQEGDTLTVTLQISETDWEKGVRFDTENTFLQNVNGNYLESGDKIQPTEGQRTISCTIDKSKITEKVSGDNSLTAQMTILNGLRVTGWRIYVDQGQAVTWAMNAKYWDNKLGMVEKENYLKLKALIGIYQAIKENPNLSQITIEPICLTEADTGTVVDTLVEVDGVIVSENLPCTISATDTGVKYLTDAGSLWKIKATDYDLEGYTLEWTYQECDAQGNVAEDAPVYTVEPDYYWDSNNFKHCDEVSGKFKGYRIYTLHMTSTTKGFSFTGNVGFGTVRACDALQWESNLVPTFGTVVYGGKVNASSTAFRTETRSIRVEFTFGNAIDASSENPLQVQWWLYEGEKADDSKLIKESLKASTTERVNNGTYTLIMPFLHLPQLDQVTAKVEWTYPDGTTETATETFSLAGRIVEPTDDDFITVWVNQVGMADTAVRVFKGASMHMAWVWALEAATQEYHDSGIYPDATFYCNCGTTTFGDWVNYGGIDVTGTKSGFIGNDKGKYQGQVAGGGVSLHANGFYCDLGIGSWYLYGNESITINGSLYSLESAPTILPEHSNLWNAARAFYPEEFKGTENYKKMNAMSDEELTAWLTEKGGLEKVQAAAASRMTAPSDESVVSALNAVTAAIENAYEKYQAAKALEDGDEKAFQEAVEEANVAITAARESYTSMPKTFFGSPGYLMYVYSSLEPYKSGGYYTKLQAMEEWIADYTGSDSSEKTEIQDMLNSVMAKMTGYSNIFTSGKSYGDWWVLACSRGGWLGAAPEHYLSTLPKAETLTTATDAERITLALTACGIDASDYVEKFSTYDESMLFNGKIFALLALDSNEKYVGDRQAYVEALVAAALTDGGWNLYGTGDADVDVTAMTLQALVPYYKEAKEASQPTESQQNLVSQVEKGIEKLKSLQDRRTGGFLNSNEQLSTCSTAQVIVALSTLGIDAADWETSRGTTPLDAISKTYIATDAGFGENIGASYYDTIATEQAAYALVAYERFKNGKVALYDMKDVTETLASAASMEQVKAAAIALLNSTYYAYDKTKYTDRSQKALDQALDAALNGVKTADTADKVSEAKAAGLAAMAAVPTISSSAGSEGSQPSDSKITVTFRLIGCTQSTDKIDLSKQPGEYYGAKYENWIKTKTYTLDEGATVGSLFEKALGDAGISYDGLSGNYIKNINGIGELTNGAYSGWMYTVNGKHPNIGLNSYSLKDGDVVIWHYVNDYRYEVSDWSGTSNGSAATWDPWKNVPDTTGGSYVISPSTTEKDESDGSADPSQSGDNDEEQKAEATAAKIEKLTSGVKKTTVSAKSKVSSGSITISWVKSAGYKVDGYQIFRSTKKNSGYGTKPFFTTTKTTYKNTKSLKSGTRYYYKVRGYRKINGKTVYTEWSNKVSRVAA